MNTTDTRPALAQYGPKAVADYLLARLAAGSPNMAHDNAWIRAQLEEGIREIVNEVGE